MHDLTCGCRRVAMAAAGVFLIATAGEAHAQSRLPGCQNERVLPFKNLFSATFHDLKQLPSASNAGIVALGGAGALFAHPADQSVTKTFSSSAQLEETLEAGAIVGGMPAQIGAAFATYGLGRMIKNDCVAAVGGELVQAQLIAQVLTYGIKGTVRRARPEGGGFAFPSGHTTSAFASATVLQRHFGWKVGIPAYGAATYVAAQRVQGKRHYLSDVAFGAALGIVAGRTVTMPGGHKMTLGPIATDFGPAAGFTLLGKK
jgi:membrane-associated phospholipid phosphatase